MSEEMALALANFCLASLDSDPANDASAFLRLGSLNPEGEAASEPEPIRRVGLREDERIPLSDWLDAGDGEFLLGLVLLQSPGGGERGGAAVGVPPRPEAVSHRERVVLVPGEQNGSEHAAQPALIRNTPIQH